MAYRFEVDKRWSDKFLPEIKSILGGCLISEAPITDDREKNTDLIVLTMAPFRIACRVRKHSYFARYPGQFTIRASRPTGTKTELAKIVEGWGDYLFYGFADDADSSLHAWGLGSLNVFRLWFNTQIVKNHGALPGDERSNGDESSKFRVFEWSDIWKDFVIASHNIPGVATQ